MLWSLKQINSGMQTMEHLFQLWFWFIFLVWSFFSWLDYREGKLLCCPYKDMSALEQSLPCPLNSFASAIKYRFVLIHKMCTSSAACQLLNVAAVGQLAGGLLEPTWRMTAVKGDARGSGFLWAAGRCSMPGGTFRARQHSHLYIQEFGRFRLDELHFLKPKQLREVERRICNIRLK